jgi:predicted dehydrogenase
MIRVGIVGLGRIADLHYLGYAENLDAGVCAVCDVNPETAARRGSEWGVAKVYTDYHELLADPEIDAVEILTPQTNHEPLVIDAARAGKHIAVQKPMTTSLESADRMLAAVKDAGVLYKVTDNYLTYPPIALARKLITDGVIGEPITMRMKFVGGRWEGGWEVPLETWAWRLEEVAQGRGIQTFDHGHHMWTTAWHLMGDFERVASWIDTTAEIIDCPAVMMWKHQGKRYGTCDYTQSVELAIPSKYYACDEWFEVTGSRGIVLVRRCTGNLQDGPAVSLYTSEGWTHHDVESDWSSGFRYATRNFIRAIQSLEAPLLTGEQARHILRFALALRKSSDLRREVSLDEMP